MTPAQLRALSEKATPGEWTHSVEDHDIGRGMVTRRSVVVGGDGENIIRLGYPSVDCEFIAACVNAIRTQLAGEAGAVGDLLAVIHGDGGHYQAEHGTAKAAAEALTKYNKVMQDIATGDSGARVAVPGRDWYCPHCKVLVAPEDVTFEQAHDERAGGCGGDVSDTMPTPPASGEVVGVPRESVDAAIHAMKQAELGLTMAGLAPDSIFPRELRSAIAMLSAAPKQAMGLSEMALSLLVAAGHVSQAKVDESLAIAAALPSPPEKAPASPAGGV